MWYVARLSNLAWGTLYYMNYIPASDAEFHVVDGTINRAQNWGVPDGSAEFNITPPRGLWYGRWINLVYLPI